MASRWMRFAVMLVTLFGALAVVGGFGQSTEGGKGDESAGPGYVRYAYQMESGASGLSELTTTEITPMSDGRYEVVTTIQAISDPSEVRIGFSGASLQWLGLYMSEGSTGRLDISQLSALSDKVLEPNKTYLLPDGALLQMGNRVVVAGLAGIEGVYTKPSAAGVTITVVLADDLRIRQLLPFPLRVSIEYAASVADVTHTYSGKIELVEYTTAPR